MSSILFILNEAPYGSERAYNALRLADEEDWFIEAAHKAQVEIR